MFYYSTHINFYQDNKDVFTVVHPIKLILWRRLSQEKQQKPTQNTPADPMAMLRKQVFAELTMSACNDVVLFDKQVKQLIMIPSKKMKEEFNIQKITYWFNPKEKKIEKQEIEYTANYPVIRQEMIYHEFSTNYKGDVASTAINNVYDSRKKLLPIYKNYSVKFQ
jgi:hypothetical protein